MSVPLRYLSVVCMFQNEAAYLEEWLAFCVLEGAEQFLLYDNASTDGSLEVLRPWIAAGLVEVIDWPVPFEHAAQLKAYNDALVRLRGQSRWAAFIDVDEFLFSPSGRTLVATLKDYEDHAAVIVNWQCYGSSGHKTRPPGLTIESYTRRAKADWARNRRVKSIVDPARTTGARSVHLFELEPGQSMVNESFELVRVERCVPGRMGLRHVAAFLPYLPFEPYALSQASIREVSVENLRINHYVTRSAEESARKYKDRTSMRTRDRSSYTRYHDRNEIEDPVLAARAGQVRRVIERVRAEQSLLPKSSSHR